LHRGWQVNWRDETLVSRHQSSAVSLLVPHIENVFLGYHFREGGRSILSVGGITIRPANKATLLRCVIRRGCRQTGQLIHVGFCVNQSLCVRYHDSNFADPEKQTVSQVTTKRRGVDKSLARPTSRYILFDGENISFDASLVLYIYIYTHLYITNVPPIMIINMIYENQNLLSL
jgi:hypothetical protein